MGQSYESTFGYGLLLMEDDNVDSNIFEIRKPNKGFTDELVGDLVLGEDCGMFYKVKDVTITIKATSEKYYNDYATEYTDFEVSDIDAELSEWLERFQEEKKLVGRIGVFQVGNFG